MPGGIYIGYCLYNRKERQEDMITSSNNLYCLIKKSKVEVISVTQRYRAEIMEKDIYRITTYNFIKNLRHLVKSRVFNHIDWKIEQKSKDVLS